MDPISASYSQIANNWNSQTAWTIMVIFVKTFKVKYKDLKYESNSEEHPVESTTR